MNALKSLEETVASSSVGGTVLHDLIADLYPICRSITGDGVRETLRRVNAYLPLKVSEVPSGTPVFDWTVPREWNISDAWIANGAGDRIVDFRQSNLHVVSYSVPVRATMPFAELRPHLHTLPDRPDWIPYKTSYYHESWGFCLRAEQLQMMTDPVYEVCIDSTLEDGYLTYGECCIPGETEDEVLLSCHVCHPSLCNDNLSGIAVAVFLGRWLSTLAARRFSYRILFIPGTIGAITWLARNQDRLSVIRYGLVLSGVGAPGPLVYKRSRRGNTGIDRAAAHVLQHCAEASAIRDFMPYGYDERQYCSPGVNLAVGCLSRTPFGEYPEYHTSADNLDFVAPATLEGSYQAARSIIEILERNARYLSCNPMCEPQLGKRGLYGAMGGAGFTRSQEMALLWVLNLCDGAHSLLDIAERASLPFASILNAASLLEQNGLIRSTTSAEPIPFAERANADR